MPDAVVAPSVVAPAVVVAAVVVVGAFATAPSMALVTPLVASSFWVRRVFLSSLLPGSSIGLGVVVETVVGLGVVSGEVVDIVVMGLVVESGLVESGG